MNILLPIIFAVAMGDLPPEVAQAPKAPTAQEPEYTLRVAGCSNGMCLVVAKDLATLLQSNNANFERAEKAEAELVKLREMKGCAKVEGAPRPPKLKKDRDS